MRDVTAEGSAVAVLGRVRRDGCNGWALWLVRLPMVWVLNRDGSVSESSYHPYTAFIISTHSQDPPGSPHFQGRENSATV